MYDPVVQVLTNAAAMAVMIIFPPSAAVIVPMLAVADIVNNVDDMVSKHDKGKLTLKSASIDMMQIGLDVLPAARGAKFLNPAQSAIQEAEGAANMRLVLFDAVQFGGQFIVMYERTKEQLVEIQDKQNSVMAEKYRALIARQLGAARLAIREVRGEMVGVPPKSMRQVFRWVFVPVLPVLVDLPVFVALSAIAGARSARRCQVPSRSSSSASDVVTNVRPTTTESPTRKESSGQAGAASMRPLVPNLFNGSFESKNSSPVGVVSRSTSSVGGSANSSVKSVKSTVL